jgi:hypothetical protein
VPPSLTVGFVSNSKSVTLLDEARVACEVKVVMDEAERRFQECLDRFSRELGDLVMSCVTEQIESAAAAVETSPTACEPATVETSGEQVVTLKLEALRPHKPAGAMQVNPNSILGAELGAAGPLRAAVEAAPAVADAPPVPKQPLFVHRRARDGRIHEIRRASELPASG